MHQNDVKAMLRAAGAVFAFGDRKTQYWTVPVDIHDSEAFQKVREAIPFQSLYCHGGTGGLVIYLDKPREQESANICRMILDYAEKTGWGDLALAGTGNKETDDLAIKIVETARSLISGE